MTGQGTFQAESGGSTTSEGILIHYVYASLFADAESTSLYALLKFKTLKCTS